LAYLAGDDFDSTGNNTLLFAIPIAMN
jgi:hypothetical protein